MPRTSKDIITKCPKCGSSSIDFTFCERTEETTYELARWSCDFVGGVASLATKAIPVIGNNKYISNYIGNSVSDGLKEIFDIKKDRSRIAYILNYHCNICDKDWEIEWDGNY